MLPSLCYRLSITHLKLDSNRKGPADSLMLQEDLMALNTILFLRAAHHLPKGNISLILNLQHLTNST